jgi:hypothetical protein
MATIDDSRPGSPDAREEEDLSASTLQLRLATSIVDSLIERNGGRDVADRFWDDDSFDASDDRDEYLDQEFRVSDEETLPEMNQINWNIHECN